MTDGPLQVYVGWDPHEAVAYDVAEFSIRKRATVPVDVRPIKLHEVREILTRPIEKKDGKLWCPISQAPMATEFAVSRFMVPFLQKTGWALFMDCDMLVQKDIAQLFALADPQYAVMVVKHKQVPKEKTKADGQIQTYYHRKNWSSVVLWNCDHPGNRRLTLEALNTWPGRDLHAFKWLEDTEIGELPHEWNILVDVSSPGILHYTLGGPWLPNYKRCGYSREWLEELAEVHEAAIQALAEKSPAH